MPAKSYADLVREALQVVGELDVDRARERLDADDGTVFLDVRETEEIRHGTIPGAVPIPRGILEGHVEDAFPERSVRFVVFCARGHRSALAGRTLKEMGYEDVVHLAGGFAAWARSGQPVGRPRAF